MPFQFFVILSQGELKRTEARKAFLEQHPTARLCQRQMQENNYIQPACRNVTAGAGYLDQYAFVVNYQNIPAQVRENLYRLYSLARHAAYPWVSEYTNVNHQEGQMKFGVQYGRDLRTVNITIDTPRFSSKFENLELHQAVFPLVVYHPYYNQMNIFAQRMANQQPLGKKYGPFYFNYLKLS